MAANKPAWPNCGCLDRCRKPKCNRTGGNPGSRELAQTGEGAKGALSHKSLLVWQVVQARKAQCAASSMPPKNHPS